MSACEGPILECDCNVKNQREGTMKTRRTVIRQGAALAAGLAATSSLPRFARAQAKPVKIAIIVPLSGPWARQGTLVKWGAETAVAEINAGGGIKSMGGAKLGMGAWLSTFTLAITEVTERAQLPWLTLSYADTITSRGFKFVFQSSMPAGR